MTQNNVSKKSKLLTETLYDRLTKNCFFSKEKSNLYSGMYSMSLFVNDKHF